MAATFSSGPWIGFYVYLKAGRRHLMDLQLRFHAGRIGGDGADDIAAFVIDGFYDEKTGECGWQKIYPTHSVTYFGFRESKGIWGTWTAKQFTGGFHIWPLSEGGPPDWREREEEKTEDLVTDVPAAVPLRTAGATSRSRT